jgi:multiple sugar transport system ATP-binding protein
VHKKTKHEASAKDAQGRSKAKVAAARPTSSKRKSINSPGPRQVLPQDPAAKIIQAVRKTPAITLSHVNKQKENVNIITDLDLTIAGDDFFVFVGPSASEVSMVLKMLAGLEKVTTGSILLGEWLINDVPPGKRDLSLMGNLGELNNWKLAFTTKNVYEKLAGELQKRRMPKDEIRRRVGEMAGLLGIPEQLSQRLQNLSVYNRFLLLLGCSLILMPRAILFDDPISDLPPEFRSRALKFLLEIRDKAQVPFILSTNNWEEAMAVGTRIAILKRGSIQQIDTPRNVYQAPRNVFVAGFFGERPMNFVPASLIGRNERLYVNLGEYELMIPDDRQRSLTGFVNKSVYFGVRPEDIFDPKYMPPGLNLHHVQGQVKQVLLKGNSAEVIMSLGTWELTARVDARTEIRKGEQVQLALNLDNIHIFDPETELAIR